MVGMGVRLQHMGDVQPMLGRRPEHPLGRPCVDRSVRRIIVEDRIDDRCLEAFRIPDEIGDRIGLLVEKPAYFWRLAHAGFRGPLWPSKSRLEFAGSR